MNGTCKYKVDSLLAGVDVLFKCTKIFGYFKGEKTYKHLIQFLDYSIYGLGRVPPYQNFLNAYNMMLGKKTWDESLPVDEN